MAENPRTLRWGSTDNLLDVVADDNDPQLFIVKHAFTSQGDGQLTVHRGEKIEVTSQIDGDWVEAKNAKGEFGWIPSSYIVKCDSLEKYPWYHGNITRAAAEVALSSGINGSFLIRGSESKPGQYSISLRYDGRMYHYRISQDTVSKEYFVKQDIKFRTIYALVRHHSQQSDGLVCTLRYPAPNPKKPVIFGFSQQDEWEMERADLDMGQKLGGGQYGDVYKGTYKRNGQFVAVKTFKEETTDATEFLKEAAVMKKIRHPHLVQLLGVCTRELPFFIVIEYMPKGNLLEYIRGPEGRNLDAVVLVYMAQQIASAMSYLEERQYIHRDLAASNCLVGNEYQIKVAGFRLSRFVENDIYNARSRTKFRIKWTSPEALVYNQFSVKSDIWAFGILLWELATQGMSPYPGVELSAVYELLEKNYRLECPEGCPPNLYDMMRRCWEWEPHKRPSFAELHKELNSISNINEEAGEGKEERAAQQDSLRTEVQKALERGAVRVEIVKCVTMGPPEAGKTQLKHALLGDFTPIEKSTDASTQATPAVEIIAAGEQKWQTLNFKQLQSAMQTTASKKDLPQRLTHEDPQSNLHKHTQSSYRESTLEDRTPADVVPSHIDDSLHKDFFERRVSTCPSQATDINPFRNLKEKVVKAILQSQSSEAGINIHRAKLIYTVDSGGQPSFLDFHPVTATFVATYLLLYNMEEGLDAKPKMTYRRKDYPTKHLPESTQSNLEIIRRSLFTLHHFKERYHEKHERLTNLWGDKFKPSTYDPPIIIIGTRRKEPMLKQNEERLQSECQRIPSMERVQLSFVNSLDPDREEIKRLQRLVCTNAGTFQFPLSWFQLHLMCLASEFGDVPEHEHIPGVFTFSELCTLCLKEGLVSSDDEFKAMVTVFHSLGVFSCPDLDLQEEVEDSEILIFINPGLLFADVTKILEIPFRDFSKVLDKQSLVDLQQTGELTTEALDELGISNTLRSSHQGFHERLVRWLVHWGLAAEIEVGKKWFIPSVLPPKSNPSESTIRFEPFPLSICFLQESSSTFAFHYLPEGLFPHFIVQLVKIGYTLLENKSKYACPPRCRDFMSLMRRRDHNVPEFNIDLIDKASHLLVNLTPAKKKLLDKPHLEAYSEAGAILAELIDVIKKANKNLYRHSSHNVAICCSCTCGDFPEDHLAKVLEQRQEIKCLYYKRSKSWEDDCNDPLKEVTISFLSHSAGLNTPEDTGTSESPRGDEEQNTIVHGPSPGPGKHGSKDDVTRRDNSSLPSSEQDVPDSLTIDNGDGCKLL